MNPWLKQMQKEASMRKPFLVALIGLALAACGSDEGPQTPDGPEGGPCQIRSDKENTPAYPFNFQQFKSDIWPDLVSSCGAGGCHKSPSANTYNVWSADEKTCPDVQSFNAFFEKVSYQNVESSLLIKNMNGVDPHSPSFATSPLLTEIQAFVQAAADLANPPTDQTNLFDKDVFAQKVQPALDELQCASSGCHGLPAGIAGLAFALNPANPSAELDANFVTLTSTKYIDQTLTDATASKLYKKSTDGHRTVVFAGSDLADLDSWIQLALDAANEGETPVLCEDGTKFNFAVFGDEIRPMLEGELDYNDINNGNVRTGCTRGPCHGMDRGPGTFYLKPGGTDEELVNSFRCFVDTKNPSNSQVLLCPLNLAGCRAGLRHPGEDVFDDVLDLNYQKLLSYIYATEAGNSPLDFAFFVRKINPIFSNPDDCADAGIACADGGCHERQSDGSADNGSNFPLIRDATDEPGLFANFVASANFTFFPDGSQSSLVLYPTNEIEDVDNNALATGEEHPGGVCFDINSQQALDIQKFAGGLRPNVDGFLQDFLVAGVFPAANVTDEVAPFDERTIEPKIFDRSGQSVEFNSGEWDGLFSANAEVDLLEAFPAAAANINQVAYALVYVMNTASNDEDVVVTVESENDVQLFIGDSPGTIGRDGDGVSDTVTLPNYLESKQLTRIMLKVFQKEGNATFAFTMNFTDENGVPLNDEGKELVFVLSNVTGGI
jgi:hypothetical protein